MKKLVLSLGIALLHFTSSAQTTIIPDPIFEQYLINQGFDTGSPDGSIPTANLTTVYVIQIQSLGINSLQGIEDMPNLAFIDCSSNNLTSLDLSNKSNLVSILCHNNQLTSLNVTNSANLKTIWASYNQLSSIDLSTNAALNGFECRGNNFSALNVSNLTSLTFLGCSLNSISSLDLSANANLKRLDCSNNNLSALDLTNNPQLDSLICDTNNLTALDLSHQSFLRVLLCQHNMIDGTLDVSDNVDLRWFSCTNNMIDIVNINNCPGLQRLWVDGNQLTSLDISACPVLYWLSACTNNLQCLNLQNGNNVNFAPGPCLWINPGLTCVQVDDPVYSASNWSAPSTVYYTSNCHMGVQTETACNQFSWINGMTYLASANNQVYTITNGSVDGSDSTIYLNLTIVPFSTNVSQSGVVLTAAQAGASYQWLDCDNNYAIIGGATDQSFTPAVTGNYSVEITTSACSDTSACYSVSYLGLEKLSNTNKTLIGIVDLLGRETTFKPNTPLIYIYSDGTRMRVMKLEE
jgi:Leucine-rich repeat (LRR) protein